MLWLSLGTVGGLAAPLPLIAGPITNADSENMVAKISRPMVSKMYEDGRYCIDILDQLAAVNAAIDAVALLVLTDHVHACVREAIEAGDADDKVEELVSTLRRYVRTR